MSLTGYEKEREGHGLPSATEREALVKASWDIPEKEVNRPTEELSTPQLQTDRGPNFVRL